MYVIGCLFFCMEMIAVQKKNDNYRHNRGCKSLLDSEVIA